LKFETTDGVLAWHDGVKRVVHAPFLRLTLFDVDDSGPGGNNNGTIQAGETFDLAYSRTTAPRRQRLLDDREHGSG
jgi:hypothetical protein